MTGGTRRLLVLLIGLLGSGTGLGGVVLAALLARQGAAHLSILLCLGLAMLGVTLCWLIFGLLDSHFDDLERLRAAILVAGVDPALRLPEAHWGGTIETHPVSPRSPDAVQRLRQAVETLITRRLIQHPSRHDRLAQVLATLDEAVLVITEHGVITLLNGPARALLASHQIGLGSSIFAALHRDSLLEGMSEAHQQQRPIPWSLRDVDGYRYDARIAPLPPPDGDPIGSPSHQGVVIRLQPDADGLGLACRIVSGAEPRQSGTVEHDFRFFEAPALPPPAPPLDPALPLSDLPGLVLDCETTGLDVQQDRVLQVGAVRIHGDRLFPMVNLDRLVNPGEPIPPASTRIHGISDDLVADAPGFAGIWPALEPLLRGAVLIGHNVAFDRTILRGECQRAGLDWPDLPLLDTFLLASLLLPGQNDLNLEVVAARLGVDVHGRHTALGDALVTAEIWRRLLPLLEAAGVGTLGALLSFQDRASALKAKQKALGW